MWNPLISQSTELVFVICQYNDLCWLYMFLCCCCCCCCLTTHCLTITSLSVHNSAISAENFPTPCDPRVLILKKSHSQDELGLSIAGGNNTGIFVQGVKHNSIAARHSLHCGDQILMVIIVIMIDTFFFLYIAASVFLTTLICIAASHPASHTCIIANYCKSDTSAGGHCHKVYCGNCCVIPISSAYW